jgi:hypothetical protein
MPDIDRVKTSDEPKYAVQMALRGVSATLPHLAGLAASVRIELEPRVATAAVAASGRLLVNPQWFVSLTVSERIFVAAHELMHLALRSHERCHGTDAKLFNIAHDYIINDMLRIALDCPIPADGLDWPGARTIGAERMVTELQQRGSDLPTSAWTKPIGSLGEALSRAGLASAPAADSHSATLDVLDDLTESNLFPNELPVQRARRTEIISAVADSATALGALRGRFDKAFSPPSIQPKSGDTVMYNVLDERWHPPWQRALQRWMDDNGFRARTYSRSSRRQGARDDVVLPGSRREGWRLNLVLDTSGSMTEILPKALSMLRAFCESASVSSVRILQCGEQLESDEVVVPADLDLYPIRGGLNGDLKPGMYRMAEDPEVEAVLVITDGGEDFPEEPMPYTVLWAIVDRIPDYFRRRYGLVIAADFSNDEAPTFTTNRSSFFTS